MLVSYNGRVGYDASLQGALDDVFGPGAGSAVAQPGQQPQQPAPGTAIPAPNPANPDQAAAAASIQQAINQLKAAQQSGDFAAQGQALAALDAAVQRTSRSRGARADLGSGARSGRLTGRPGTIDGGGTGLDREPRAPLLVDPHPPAGPRGRCRVVLTTARRR